MKAIINAATFDLDEFRTDRYVLFDQQIIATGPMAEFPSAQFPRAESPNAGIPEADQVYDLRGKLLMPGLVLGHGHLYSAFARGWNTPFSPQSFRGLLEQLWWKLDAGLDAAAVRLSALTGGLDLLRGGVTTIIDHHASGRAIAGSLDLLKRAVCDQIGLRGIFCFETSDRFPVEQCIQENLAFAAGCAGQDRAAGLFGLHASMTLSAASLDLVARHRGDLPIHVHVAESPEDQADSLDRYGKRVVSRLDDAGLLDAGSLLAHCIHIDKTEREILARRGCQVVLNPLSNMNNAVGLPDQIALRQSGIPVLIGNDGLGANFGRDIQATLWAGRHQAGNPLAVGLDDIRGSLRAGWDYAGARLGCRLGRIDAGYAADFLAIDYDPPTSLAVDNALGHWFYGILDNLRPQRVWCAGQPVLVDGKTALDEPAIRAEARSLATALWKNLQA